MKVMKFIAVILMTFFIMTSYSQEINSKMKPEKQGGVNYSTEQTQAMFQGGLDSMINYITSHIVLPEKKEGLKATIMVKIVIDNQGLISSVDLMNSINEEVDKAVVAVIKSMPKWIPAEVNGEKIVSEQIIGYELRY